jgi:uncharacterized protein
MKRCLVAYATPERQYLWPVEIPHDATVKSALDAARDAAPEVAVPWERAEVGIFGEPCSRDRVPADGDRIEIYRPLARDPRLARRERVGRPRGRAVPVQGRDR